MHEKVQKDENPPNFLFLKNMLLILLSKFLKEGFGFLKFLV
jgi:hypothetical protein